MCYICSYNKPDLDQIELILNFQVKLLMKYAKRMFLNLNKSLKETVTFKLQWCNPQPKNYKGRLKVKI